MASPRTPFDKLTPIHPNRRITLETGLAPLAPRLMDLFVPLGFGQRARRGTTPGGQDNYPAPDRSRHPQELS